jgi:hypothetical protein
MRAEQILISALHVTPSAEKSRSDLLAALLLLVALKGRERVEAVPGFARRLAFPASMLPKTVPPDVIASPFYVEKPRPPLHRQQLYSQQRRLASEPRARSMGKHRQNELLDWRKAGRWEDRASLLRRSSARQLTGHEERHGRKLHGTPRTKCKM